MPSDDSLRATFLETLIGQTPTKVTFPKSNKGKRKKDFNDSEREAVIHTSADDEPPELDEDGNPYSPAPAIPPQAELAEGVIAQIEREFAPKISPDDPLHYFIRAFDLLIEKSYQKNLEISEKALAGSLSDLRKGMDVAGQRKLKELNEEMMTYTRNAIRAINSARNDANQYLVSALVEIKSLANQMQNDYRLSKWMERAIGALIAVILIGLGIVIGRAKW